MSIAAPGPYHAHSTTSSFTSAYTSNTTSTSDSEGSDGSSLFSVNGTPALILAFLAIGLFVGGMLAMFGLRRRGVSYVPRRWFGHSLWPSESNTTPTNWAAQLDAVADRPRRRKKDFGKPPELFDIYTSQTCLRGALWKDITPLSAKLMIQSSPELAKEMPEPPSNFERRILSHIDPLGLLHRSQPRAPQILPSSQERSRIEVAVVVAMPAETDTLDYTVGLAVQSYTAGDVDLDEKAPLSELS